MEVVKAPNGCPLCAKPAVFESGSDNDSFFFQCDRCGHFYCNKNYIHTISAVSPQLSGLARQYHERGEHLIITIENHEALAKLAPRSVQHKVDKLLLALEAKNPFPGFVIHLEYEQDYPLAFASNANEFGFLVDYLKTSSVLNWASDDRGSGVQISVQGWEKIAAYKSTNSDSEKAFVAMWFDPQMREAYDKGIVTAIEADAGYRSIRVDNVEHNGKIDDRIIAEIRESKFLVADFTGNRGGVYYEAGFASGLGLPVIWTCRADHIKKVHFDTRQFNHITWKTPEELRDKLANRIRATIGLGPNAP